jgi:hypothetical protein
LLIIGLAGVSGTGSAQGPTRGPIIVDTLKPRQPLTLENMSDGAAAIFDGTVTDLESYLNRETFTVSQREVSGQSAPSGSTAKEDLALEAFRQQMLSLGRMSFSIDQDDERYGESIQELSGHAQAIVEARVESVFPGTLLNSTSKSEIEVSTDVILRVDRVIKGSVPETFLIAQRGGRIPGFTLNPAQYKIMEPGERYLLFLNPVAESRLELHPSRPGLTRFAITGTYMGMFLLDGGKVQVNEGMPKKWRERYNGVSAEQILSELRAVTPEPKR